MTVFDNSEHVIETLLEEGAYISVTRGTSMRPLFKTNRDVVKLVKPTSPIRRHDVVLYMTVSGKYVLHRVIAVDGDTLVIRGDNTYRKEYVRRGDILAVLIEFKRKGKRHSVTERGYLTYVRLWGLTYPLRHVLHFCYTLASKLYRRLFRRKNKEVKGVQE